MKLDSFLHGSLNYYFSLLCLCLSVQVLTPSEHKRMVKLEQKLKVSGRWPRHLAPFHLLKTGEKESHKEGKNSNQQEGDEERNKEKESAEKENCREVKFFSVSPKYA